MTEFPVLCPALVFLEDLDEARPLRDLESGERPYLLSGPAVVLVSSPNACSGASRLPCDVCIDLRISLHYPRGETPARRIASRAQLV